MNLLSPERGAQHQFFSFSIDVCDKPEQTIYLLIETYAGKEVVVYVGKSESNVLNRLNTHVNDSEKVFDRIFVFSLCDVPYTLDQVEHAFVSYYQPLYNKALRDKVTKLDFVIISEFLVYAEEHLREQGVI